MTHADEAGREPEEPPIRFTDNRKIDREPQSGPVAEESAAGPAGPAPTEDDVPKADALLLEERTLDLQRLQAEYANYRKRAERDRLAAGDLAIGRALSELLPVVDDLDRAKAHGDLTGPLKAVADKLDAAFAKLGLVAFGEVGDPFDPSLHEAVLHDESDQVEVPTCTTVMRQGYQHNGRLLRAAMVGVSDPVTPAAPPGPDEGPATAPEGGAAEEAEAAESAAQDTEDR